MSLNKEKSKEYYCIYIPIDSRTELLIGSLDNIFSFSNLSLDTLMFANLNHEICMCTDSIHVNQYDNVNLLATEIYRDYLHVYSSSDIVYGPALIFGYKFNTTQNIEYLQSVKDIYIDELTSRSS